MDDRKWSGAPPTNTSTIKRAPGPSNQPQSTTPITKPSNITNNIKQNEKRKGKRKRKRKFDGIYVDMVNMDIMDGINDDIDNVDSLSCNLNDNGSTYDDPNNNNDKYGDKITITINNIITN